MLLFSIDAYRTCGKRVAKAVPKLAPVCQCQNDMSNSERLTIITTTTTTTTTKTITQYDFKNMT